MRDETERKEGGREGSALAPTGSAGRGSAHTERYNFCSVLGFLCLTGNIQQAQGFASYPVLCQK